MQYHLHVQFDDSHSFLITRDGQHSIGQTGADIKLQNTTGLPIQAVLIMSGTRLFIRPEPGTFVTVNGVVIDQMTALQGDETLLIGNERLILRRETAPTVSPTNESLLPGRSGSGFFALGDPITESSMPVIPKPVPSIVVPPQPSVPPIEAIPALDDDNQTGSSIRPISRSITEEADQVSFTAYYPRSLEARSRGGLYVYAHLSEAAMQIARDVQKFVEELGGEVPRPRTSSKTAQVKVGTPITVTVECDDVEFDPPSLTRKWDDEWVRFAFDFKLPESLINEQIVAQITIQIYGLEVARIANCTMEVLPLAAPPIALATPTNALAAAKQNAMSYDEARLYQKIFVSYSRADSEVVQAYRLAQEALGNEVFVDTYSIRTGADWQVALAKAIDEADILQLFWSDKSAASPNVHDEWDYALTHRCTYDDCRTFIRPVFWTHPLPAKPPPELSHLNFRYVALVNAENK